MTSPSDKHGAKDGKKIRVPFRQNRSARPPRIDWTRQARDAEDHELDAERGERVTAKGDLSRRRTITVRENPEESSDTLTRGIVLSMRGLFVEVDDGQRVWPCTVRRILRTRLIKERHPLTVGDHVRFRIVSKREGVAREGVVEEIEPRHGQLRRLAGKRIHTIVANVDQAIIVGSANEPPPKPNLIDRYIVASHAGEIVPIVCINKIDLDEDRVARNLLDRYTALDYTALCTSAATGEGIDALRELLTDRASVIVGQSGVGKSSLLNLVQPGLQLKTGDIIEQTSKGRHTTTTATLLKLDFGGYVVDTPGIRSFDLSTVQRHELEMFFVEFVRHVPDCKFPDCTHTHENNCAVKAAVDRGDIHPERYNSYLRLFQDPSGSQRREKQGAEEQLE